jgi:hypothetical protein
MAILSKKIPQKMKNIIALFLLFLNLTAFAQAPEGVNYQAVIRDNNGGLISNGLVGLKITLFQSELNGTIVFEESFDVTTSEFGLVNIVIGEGSSISGDFSLIDWSNGPYFIEVSADEMEE